MKLPIDTSAISFLCALPPERVVDFDTKVPRTDENGEPLWLVHVVALSEGDAQILPVKVAGQLGAGVKQGAPLKVVALVASPWTMGERSGVSFKASRIEPVAAPARGSSQ
jgi:hypothetical protein